MNSLPKFISLLSSNIDKVYAEPGLMIFLFKSTNYLCKENLIPGSHILSSRNHEIALSSVTLLYYKAVLNFFKAYQNQLEYIPCFEEALKSTVEWIKLGHLPLIMIDELVQYVAHLIQKNLQLLTFGLALFLEVISHSSKQKLEPSLFSIFVNFIVEILSPFIKSQMSQSSQEKIFELKNSTGEFIACLIEALPSFFITNFFHPLIYHGLFTDFILNTLLNVTPCFSTGSHFQIFFFASIIFISIQEAYSDSPPDSLKNSSMRSNPEMLYKMDLQESQSTDIPSLFHSIFKHYLEILLKTLQFPSNLNCSQEYIEMWKEARSNSTEALESIYYVLQQPFFDYLLAICCQAYANEHWELVDSIFFALNCTLDIGPEPSSTFPLFLNAICSIPFFKYPVYLKKSIFNFIASAVRLFQKSPEFFPFDVLSQLFLDPDPSLTKHCIKTLRKLVKPCGMLLSPHFQMLAAHFSSRYNDSSFALKKLILETFSILSSFLPLTERPQSYSLILGNVIHKLESDVKNVPSTHSHQHLEPAYVLDVIDGLQLLSSFFDGLLENKVCESKPDPNIKTSMDEETFLNFFFPCMIEILNKLGHHPTLLYHLCHLVSLIFGLCTPGSQTFIFTWTPFMEALCSSPHHLTASVFLVIDPWFYLIYIYDFHVQPNYLSFVSRGLKQSVNSIEQSQSDFDFLHGFLSSLTKALSCPSISFDSIVFEVANVAFKCLALNSELTFQAGKSFLEKYLLSSFSIIPEEELSIHKRQLFSQVLLHAFNSLFLNSALSSSIAEQLNQFLFFLLQYPTFFGQKVIYDALSDPRYMFQPQLTDTEKKEFVKLLLCARQKRRFDQLISELKQRLP
ncbi:hypothetical protein HMI54_014637 [Coelomomyces lativittatus]|nr:hypothetical protein HMI54_014637 [Coelomomyces lativittatus]